MSGLNFGSHLTAKWYKDSQYKKVGIDPDDQLPEGLFEYDNGIRAKTRAESRYTELKTNNKVVDIDKESLKKSTNVTSLIIEEVNSADDIQYLSGLTFNRFQINKFTWTGLIDQTIKTKELLIVECDYLYEVLKLFDTEHVTRLYVGKVKHDLFSKQVQLRFPRLVELVVKGNASKIIKTYQLQNTKLIECDYLLPFDDNIEEGYDDKAKPDQHYLEVVKQYYKSSDESKLPSSYIGYSRNDSRRRQVLIVHCYAFFQRDSKVSTLVIRPEKEITYYNLGLSVNNIMIMRDVEKKESKVNLFGILPKQIQIYYTRDKLEKKLSEMTGKFKLEPM